MPARAEEKEEAPVSVEKEESSNTPADTSEEVSAPANVPQVAPAGQTPDATGSEPGGSATPSEVTPTATESGSGGDATPATTGSEHDGGATPPAVGTENDDAVTPVDTQTGEPDATPGTTGSEPGGEVTPAATGTENEDAATPADTQTGAPDTMLGTTGFESGGAATSTDAQPDVSANSGQDTLPGTTQTDIPGETLSAPPAAGVEGTDPTDETDPAEETDPEDIEIIDRVKKDSTFKGGNLSNEETLMKQYVDIEAGRAAKPAQTKNNTAAYLQLEKMIQSVAAGGKPSSAFSLSVKDLLSVLSYASSDLGGNALLNGDAVSAEAKTAMTKKVEDASKEILTLLMKNAPQNFYWYDKNAGVKIGMDLEIKYATDRLSFTENATVNYLFQVAKNYSKSGKAGTAAVNTAVTARPKKAATKVKQIVQSAASKTDKQKLDTYKTNVVNLATPDNNTAIGSAGYSPTWQMIHVFDGEAGTKSTSEGYAKAFQYLVDGTKFKDNNIRSFIAGGTVHDGKTAKKEKWNVVQMENGADYLVDIYRADQAGSNVAKYYLAGAMKLAPEQYTIKVGSANILYTYDASTKKAYGTTRRNISDKDYGSKKAVFVTGLQNIGGNYYLFNNKGKAQTGWKNVKGKKYYFDKKAYGAAKKGMATIGKKKYFFDNNGVAKTGLFNLNGKLYYAKAGALQTGWKTIGKKKYYFDKSSYTALTGFRTIQKKRYWFGNDGVMKTGWYVIDGAQIWTHLTEIGNQYYFDKKSGVMATGKKKIGKTTYYFGKDGVMNGKAANVNIAGALPKGTINVLKYGAKAGDGKDDTWAIREAIAAAPKGGFVYIPAGKYNIDSWFGIDLKSNVNLMMDRNAILNVSAFDTGKALRENRNFYHIFNLNKVSNVVIFGGQIKGERNIHMTTQPKRDENGKKVLDANGNVIMEKIPENQLGEGGMGVRVADSNNIRLSYMNIAGNWGDGIYLGHNTYADKGCNKVVIEGCTINDNRRNNISIISANNVTIDSCKISNANGVAPQCGIDIEPNHLYNAQGKPYIPANRICNNITIKNSTISTPKKATGDGQYFAMLTIYNPGDKKFISSNNLVIDNCVFNSSFGNFSGLKMMIKDTIIKGKLHLYQKTTLKNVKYNGIWKG